MSLTAADEVIAMREQIRSLEAEIERLRGLSNRAEYLFACESSLNNQLIDFCRDNGVKVPSRFFKGLSGR